ncbi:MAG: hypothetical protein N3F03_02865, partial [Ignavibacteria bacterium]|nr:hypothetical protein [Ignavibacteria bacterium]
MKKLITETDVLKLIRQGIKEIYIDENSLITPAAKDVIIREKIELKKFNPISESIGKESEQISVIAIGSDHTGYKSKQILI